MFPLLKLGCKTSFTYTADALMLTNTICFNPNPPSLWLSIDLWHDDIVQVFDSIDDDYFCSGKSKKTEIVQNER